MRNSNLSLKHGRKKFKLITVRNSNKVPRGFKFKTTIFKIFQFTKIYKKSIENQDALPYEKIYKKSIENQD